MRIKNFRFVIPFKFEKINTDEQIVNLLKINYLEADTESKIDIYIRL